MIFFKLEYKTDRTGSLFRRILRNTSVEIEFKLCSYAIFHLKIYRNKKKAFPENVTET